MTINMINADKENRVTNKLINPQILRHDQTVMNSSKLSQQNIRQTKNETEKADVNMTSLLRKIPPNSVLTGDPWQLSSTLRITRVIITVSLYVSIRNSSKTIGKKLDFMTSIAFFMLQAMRYKDQVTLLKHIWFL